jgi:hypothetical protein
MIYLNGINPKTGDYLVSPATADGFIEQVAGIDQADQTSLRNYLHSKDAVAGLLEDIDENNPAEAGWGIICHEKEDRDTLTALQTLIEHRKTQIPEQRIKSFRYRTGQSFNRWLADQGVGSGHIDPEKIPFYLLIAGNPETIPFSFSQRLGMEYRVGRLPFSDATEYTNYIDSLIHSERQDAKKQSSDLLVFAPSHDPATELSCEHLANPLALKLSDGISVDQVLRADASKANLLDHLRARPPRFLFSASHGLGLDLDDEDQAAFQGALLCQRPQESGPVAHDDILSATDITPNLDFTGTIAFFFACFSGATPSVDRFFRKKGVPCRIANTSFFSALPRRLLSKPNGAAIAVLGHIDRAWGFSFISERSDELLNPFENAIRRSLKGRPIGQALKDFYDKYAACSIELTDLIDTREVGGDVDPKELVLAWARRNDAGGYILLGDPAARTSA